MRTQRTARAVLAILLTLTTLASAIPAQAGESHPATNLPEPIAFQRANPADKVRAALTGKGYKVLKVGTNNDGNLAGVYMDMASSQLDEAARRQVVEGWYALSQAYTDPAIETYLSGLVYQERYLLCFFVARADLSAWIGGQMSDQTFAGKYIFKVMDLKTEQWVTDKDFIHKSFGVPAGKTVGPLPKPAAGGTNLVLEDDFSDPHSGWGSHEDDTASAGYVDGEYFCRETAENYIYHAQYPDLELDDFTYQVECRQVEGDPENEYGLVFRCSGEDYYKFGVTGDGYYDLLLRKDGQWTKMVDWAKSTAVERGDQVNVLKVACTGETISLYVNDEHVQTVRDDSLSKGRIGLFVGGWENMPTEARFDNVKVWSGSGGPQPTPQAGPAPTPQPTKPPPALNQTLCCGTSAGGTKIWSVRYPAGWQVVYIPDNPRDFQGVLISDPQGTIRIGLIPSTFTPPGAALDANNVDDFLDAYRAQRERENLGFKELLRQPVAGVPEGRVWAGTWGSGSSQMWATYLTILYPVQPWSPGLPRGYLIMLGVEATGPEWGRAVATYEAMLKTVQTRTVKSGSDAWTGVEAGGTAVKPMMIRWCPECCGWVSVTADRENWACPVCGTPTELWETGCNR